MPTRREFIGAAGAVALLPGCAMTNAPLPASEQVHTFSSVVNKRVSLRYLMWVPEAATRPAAGWPLLMFLHGSGERGDELARVKAHGPTKYAAAGRNFPFVLVAPQLPEGQRWDPDALKALRADLVARWPLAPDRLMVDAVRAAGGRSKFTVYPDIGHNAWDPAYADPALFDWLLAQRRDQAVHD